jgi:pimeloyl-ACP methyl ester carboxylesterase
MDDLDEVRDALGYDKINIVGGSYGTIAAQVYMRQHPDHIRAVLLGGVANTAIKQPLFFAKGAQHSLERLIEDCNADEICKSNFPDFKKEFDAVIARFDKGPVTTELINPTTKARETVNISRGSFVEVLRVMLYTAPGASFVPLLIHKAYQNDFVTFEALARRFSLGRLMARGMYLTVTCSESVPFISEQDIVKETSGTFVGDYRVRAHIDACKNWPKGDIPKNYIELVTSNLPVLLVSGDLDASTPIWLGEDLMEHLSNGKQLKIRYYGHQFDGQCVASIAAEFMEKGTVMGLNTSCADQIRRPPWITELPKQFSLQ